MFELIDNGFVDNEKAAIEEMGGDPSFLLPLEEDPTTSTSSNQVESQKEALEEEIAAILEMGGDPSFLMDTSPSPPIPPNMMKEDSIPLAAELEAAGGDPSFLLPEKDETQQKSTLEIKDSSDMEDEDEENKDWFSIGRQLAKDLILEQDDPPQVAEEEEKEKEKEPAHEETPTLAEFNAMRDAYASYFLSNDDDDDQPKDDDGDKMMNNTLSVEQQVIQSTSLKVAQDLVKTRELICQSKQEELLRLQKDIANLQKQLQHVQQRQTILQEELVQAMTDKEESLQLEQTLKDSFEATLGLAASPSTVLQEEKEPPEAILQRPPTTTRTFGGVEGPYYTALEGESFDNLQDEVEALGGDPFFLDDGDDDNNDSDNNDMTTSSSSTSISSDPSFLLNLVQQPQSKDTTTTTNKEQEKKEKEETIEKKTTNKRKGLKKSAITNEPMEEEEGISDEEELLEVGGDPNFLASFDETDDSKAYDMELLREEIEEMGGDPSFL